ncbi:MAG: InlB B-repeat-containing protein [Aedoeadaptatus pacaensis]
MDIPKLGKKKVNYVFNQWQKVKTGEADDSLIEVKPAVKIDLAKNKYTDKVTVIEASYFERFAATPIVKPIKTEKLDTPEGKAITDQDLINKITPPENKEIKSIQVINRPDPSKPGEQKATVIVTYTDGSTQGSNDNPVVIPVEVHKNIIPEAPGGQRPKDALDNYVKVIFKAGTGGSLSGNLVYYVSPEVEVDMTASAKKITKTPSVGYYVNGEKWTNKDNKALKGTFNDLETEFVFTFDKSKDIVEKIDENTKIPEGYVKVTFKTEDEDKGKLEGGKLAKIYYVNPTAGITLKVLGKNETATAKQLAVPKTAPAENYEFEKWYEEIDQTTSITSERIHVAKFKLAKVTLTYAKGGEDVTGDVPKELEVDHGTSVRLARPDGLSKDNATFAGWKIGDKTYQAGDEVTLNENTTATAQWTKAKHTVMFDLAKGTIDNKTVKDPVQVDHGATVGTVTNPVREGYVFTGWKFGKTSFDPVTTPVNSDVTLVAQWEKAVETIGENDPVDENHFIKVTFKQGAHGQLVPDKDKQDVTAKIATYKVAKDYTFNDAVKHGLVVPGIQPAQYFKTKEANGGWDQALALDKKDITFTAQYELVSNLIPVDTKGKTPEEIEQLKKDKPEGTVVVDFKVADEDKTLLDGITFYYVKKDTVVTIDSPVVMAKTKDYTFDGWKNVKFEDDKHTGQFNQDTTITDTIIDIVGMTVRFPVAGQNRMDILQLPDGETGKLQVIRGKNTYDLEVTTYKRRRKVHKIFDLSSLPGGCIQSGDMIKYWTEKNGQKSKEYHEIIK